MRATDRRTMLDGTADLKSLRKRILIVDDDEEDAGALAALLERDYKVDVASNGFSAFDRMRREPVDLILLDLVMPGLDGPGFVRELQMQSSSTPIIIVSALPNAARYAEHLGIQDSILKPVDLGELEDKIQRAIG